MAKTKSQGYDTDNNLDIGIENRNIKQDAFEKILF